MLHTTASCGHPTAAVGSPGSPARAACEAEPCPRCQAEANARSVVLTSKILEGLATLGDQAPCCRVCGSLLAPGDLVDLFHPFETRGNLHRSCASPEAVPAADELFPGRKKKLA